MSKRVPSRMYTTTALEAWLQHLDAPWEHRFSVATLTRGRQWYKAGRVRALDIAANTLTTQAVPEDRKGPAVYSILDASPQGAWTIRNSFDDVATGEALTVAGLYELEEFLLDFATHISDKSLVEPKPLPAMATPKPKRHSIKPQLCFDVEGNALVFRAPWGQRREALNQAEREAWIRLMHWARRDGFEYNAKTGLFTLADFDRAVAFIRGAYNAWHSYYQLESTPAISILRRGRQPVRLTMSLSTQDKGLHIQPIFEVEGQTVPLDLIRGLLRQGGEGFVSEYGWLSLSSQTLALIEDWQTQLGAQGDGEWPFYMAYSIYVQWAEAQLSSESVEDWRRRLLSGSIQSDAIALPGFLRSYQAEGVRWMARIFELQGHALLADEMGLGKTLQVLSLLKTFPIADKPMLVVCPASVISVWESEVHRFFPEISVKVLNSHTSFQDHAGPILWLSSYTQLRRHRSQLSDIEFSYAILDEAQAIKNALSKTAQATFAIQAQRRLAMTGTPIENRHLDIWSLFRFLMPGLLGSRRSFETAMKQSHASTHLRAQLTPFTLRRMKNDVLKELPEKTQTILPCPLTTFQKQFYQNLVNQAKAECPHGFREKGEGALHIFSLLTRLRQAAIDPALLPGQEGQPYAHSGKLMVLQERVLELIDNQEKIVIFSQFVHLLKRIEGLLSMNLPPSMIYKITGQTKDRGRVVEGFQSHAGPAIMLASLKAAGAGITLHAASYVFLLDPWWNPAVEAQAIDRVHRLGQAKPVFVYRLIAPGTLEDKMEALKVHKQGLFDTVLEDLPILGQLEQHFRSLGDLIDLS